MSELSSGSFWPSFIFGDTLRIVFQNLLLETNEDILQCSERVWSLLVQVYHLIRNYLEMLLTEYYCISSQLKLASWSFKFRSL